MPLTLKAFAQQPKLCTPPYSPGNLKLLRSANKRNSTRQVMFIRGESSTGSGFRASSAVRQAKTHLITLSVASYTLVSDSSFQIPVGQFSMILPVTHF